MNFQATRTFGVQAPKAADAIRARSLPAIGTRYSDHEPSHVVQIGRTCRNLSDWLGRYHVVCVYDDAKWYEWDETEHA